MKKAFIIIFLGSFILSIAQNIREDSLYKKAQANIYNDPDKTIETAEYLLKREKSTDDIVTIHLLIANAYVSKRNFDESLKYVLKAKSLQNKIKDPYRKIVLLTAIAIQYQQMELFDKSLESLDEADEQLSLYQGDRYLKYGEMAKSAAIRGMIYRNQYNAKPALEKLLTSVSYYREVIKGKPASELKRTFANMSVIYYNIAACYIDLKMLTKAQEYYLKSDEYAEKAEAKNLKAFALKGLAEVQTLKGEHKEAVNTLEEALRYSTDIGDIMLNERVFKGLAENYLALGEFQNYKEFKEKSLEMQQKREQNELESINRAVDTHIDETSGQNIKVKSRYSRYMYVIMAFGSFIVLIALFMIRKIFIKNKKLRKKIEERISAM